MRCYAHYVQYPYTICIRAPIAPYVMFCNDQLTFHEHAELEPIEEMEKKGSESRIQRQSKSKVSILFNSGKIGRSLSPFFYFLSFFLCVFGFQAACV